VIKITEFAGKEGKYFFGSVKIGERGQIVIPKTARNVFNINAKDDVYIFGDAEKGLGLTTTFIFNETDLLIHEQSYGTSKVGERGQVVIPQAARELLKLESGDLILVFGDIKKGLGIVKATRLKNFAIKLFQAFGNNFESIQDTYEDGNI